MENWIEVEGLTKRYTGFTLDRVNLTVPAGMVVGLVGENGAGKTTLLRGILGLLRPDGGSVRLAGRSPQEPESRIRVAAVFEDSFFYQGLNARQIDNVMNGTVPGWNRKRFRELLGQFSLPDDKPVKGYSKGMRMKLNLAVALARCPGLLILDEPTSGLDPVARGELMDILLEFVQDEEHAILLSSHITADLERIADQIAYLHGGKMVFQRDKLELMEDMVVVRCGADKLAKLPEELIIAKHAGPFGMAVLARNPKRVRSILPDCVADAASIDDMMRFYAGRDEA